GFVSGSATVTVPYGPGSSTIVEIVMNEGGNPNTPTKWEYSLQIFPATLAGGITKLGSKRLNVQGDGTYTGVDTVKEGVVRVQNDTALGSSKGGTTVEDGAALELTSGNSQNNGGIQSGIQVWGEHLTLKGGGNTSVTGTLIHPLTSLADD